MIIPLNSMNTPPDQNEFLQMIQDNKRIIFKICNAYCRNRSDREDLAQEIVYQLWKSGGHFNADHRFSTWMYRIALNVAISFYRKELRSVPKVQLSDDFHFHLTDWEDKPDGKTEMEEQINLLQQFIDELGKFDKALMILYLEENSYKEIGDILGITETNVATKLSRIKTGLKQKFSTLNGQK
jgi:RNA polymerase sigma factor (sigma-70 family)